MEKIAVLLVSEQVVPNVLFVRHFFNKGVFFDQFIFVTTERMERLGVSDNLHTVLGQQIKIKKVTVDQDDFDDITGKIKPAVASFFSGGSEIYVNLTGGTKLMALGAYQIMQKHQNALFYYLPIGRNTIEQLDTGDSADKKLEIKASLNMEDYLRAYGFEYRKDKVNQLFEPDLAVTRNIFHIFITNVSEMDKEKADKLREFRNERNPKKLPESFDQELIEYIKNKGFCSVEKAVPEKSFLEYITGGWFEEYVYRLFKDRFQLDDERVALNAVVNQVKNKNIRNEFDVLFMMNNSLYYVECKTSVNGERGLAGKTLENINSLKKNFGLNVKTALFVADDSLRVKGVLKPEINERAELYRITLIDKPILEKSEELDAAIKEYIK